jgi:hypothetical protein
VIIDLLLRGLIKCYFIELTINWESLNLFLNEIKKIIENNIFLKNISIDYEYWVLIETRETILKIVI